MAEMLACSEQAVAPLMPVSVAKLHGSHKVLPARAAACCTIISTPPARSMYRVYWQRTRQPLWC